MCGRVYSNLSNLRQHIRLIHNPTHVRCPICNKTFKSTLYLKRHLVTCRFNHGETKYSVKQLLSKTNGITVVNSNQNCNGFDDKVQDSGQNCDDTQNFVDKIAVSFNNFEVKAVNNENLSV